MKEALLLITLSACMAGAVKAQYTKPLNAVTLPNGQVMYTGRDTMYVIKNQFEVRSAGVLLPRLIVNAGKDGALLPNDADNPVMFVTITDGSGIGGDTVYALYAVKYDNSIPGKTLLAIGAQSPARKVNNHKYYFDFMVIGKPYKHGKPKS